MKNNIKIYYLIIGIILLLALFLRVYDLEWETFGPSEVETWQAVSEYQKGNFINNFYTFDTPPLRRYVVFASLSILGVSEFSFRIVSVIVGLVVVATTFLITRKLYNKNIPLTILATTITAFSILHIQFSRYNTDDIFFSLFYIIALYFFWQYLQTKSRKSYIMLGIAIGLATVSRFMAIFLLITIILYAIIKDVISIKIRPRFSLSIDNKFLKALILAIITFFLAWPFSLVTLQTDITVRVPSLDNHENSFSKDIPIFLLSFGKRISNTGMEPPPGVFELPVINYLLAFMVKENLLIVILFLLGFFYILKKSEPIDNFILFSTGMFFVLLWLQNWGFTYRYIVIIIPLLSIIAARSINLIKKDTYKFLAIGLISIILFSYALFSHPTYALSYNPLNEIIKIPETEGRYSEGMKESINFYLENCKSALGDSRFTFNILPYRQNFAKDTASDLLPPVCVVKNTIMNEYDQKIIDEYLKTNSCSLEKSIEKKGIHLIDIFICK